MMLIKVKSGNAMLPTSRPLASYLYGGNMVARYSTYIPKGHRFKDLTGSRFGRLVALEPMRRPGRIQVAWRCKCDCGRERFVDGNKLRSGHTQSCGCYSREHNAKINTTHGRTGTSLYLVFKAMHNRCKRTGDKNYKYYGARGIGVDPEWDTFEAFLSDMGERPSGMTLDRIDNDKNYGPGNCRWATLATQANNKRSNQWVVFRGERLTVTALAAKIGIRRLTLAWRLKNGWTVEKAATVPTGRARTR